MRAEVDANGTPLFRELRGEYVDGAGQVVNLREYLDYFEPLGTALSRLPDGAGGPFLYQFSGGGGRLIGAMGWVVNASAKRYGAWKLWGLWANRPIPPLTLALLWPELPDSGRLSDLIDRANRHADRLLRRDAFDEINTTRLHDERFRTLLKAHLTLAWRARIIRSSGRGGGRERHARPAAVASSPRTGRTRCRAITAEPLQRRRLSIHPRQCRAGRSRRRRAGGDR